MAMVLEWRRGQTEPYQLRGATICVIISLSMVAVVTGTVLVIDGDMPVLAYTCFTFGGSVLVLCVVVVTASLKVRQKVSGSGERCDPPPPYKAAWGREFYASRRSVEHQPAFLHPRGCTEQDAINFHGFSVSFSPSVPTPSPPCLSYTMNAAIITTTAVTPTNTTVTTTNSAVTPTNTTVTTTNSAVTPTNTTVTTTNSAVTTTSTAITRTSTAITRTNVADTTTITKPLFLSAVPLSSTPGRPSPTQSVATLIHNHIKRHSKRTIKDGTQLPVVQLVCNRWDDLPSYHEATRSVTCHSACTQADDPNLSV